MKINDIIIFGSTGSIGTSTLNSIKKRREFRLKLISTNKNAKKILKQAISFKVKDVVIEDYEVFKKYKDKFNKKKSIVTGDMLILIKYLKKKYHIV